MEGNTHTQHLPKLNSSKDKIHVVSYAVLSEYLKLYLELKVGCEYLVRFLVCLGFSCSDL